MARRGAVAGWREGQLRVARLGGTSARAWDGRASRGARQHLHHRMRCGQRDVLPAVLDARGVCRVYEMSIGNGEWKLWRKGEPFSQRFTATLSDDGNTITGRWEIAEDGTNYTTDFDLIYRRVGT